MIPKFKAWDSYDEKVVEVLSIDFEDKVAYVEQANGDRYDIHFDNLVFMQSTGLKDKNGVEIYEGDIVSVENHPFQKTEDSAEIEIEGEYPVAWDDYDLTWCAGNLLLSKLKPYIAVKGNIYEDKDLLEVEG